MIEIRKHTVRSLPCPPGHWFAIKMVTPDSFEWAVRMKCPKCETVAGLSDHDINEDGVVTPEIACPCGFHGDVVLAGWGE